MAFMPELHSLSPDFSCKTGNGVYSDSTPYFRPCHRLCPALPGWGKNLLEKLLFRIPGGHVSSGLSVSNGVLPFLKPIIDGNRSLQFPAIAPGRIFRCLWCPVSIAAHEQQHGSAKRIPVFLTFPVYVQGWGDHAAFQGKGDGGIQDYSDFFIASRAAWRTSGSSSSRSGSSCSL